MGIAKERSSGGTDTEGVRAALGEDRGSNEAGGDGSSTMSDRERWEMDVAGVYGVREVEHGGSIVGFQGAGGKDRRAEYAAGVGGAWGV